MPIQPLNTKIATFLFTLLLISGCTTVYETVNPYANKTLQARYGPAAPKQRFLEPNTALAAELISYQNEIKPILEARCVACHACYDAPCQLKLGSTSGIDRGANKQRIYDGGRLTPMAPTRLFIDANNTQEWRDKAFYPILNERTSSSQAALNNSLLAKLLQLKRNNPLVESGKLANTFKLDINDKQECPSIDEFSAFQKKHPDWGMPYAMPGLSLQQEFKIMSWLQQGAKFDSAPGLSAEAQTSIQQWETFFNRPSLKQQLVSRYIYEHLFIGHLHFAGQSKQEFFRLVRSTSPPGQTIAEIATRHPYHSPGVKNFYYRLRPIEGSIVEKTHFVYELSPKKMQRYDSLFFQPNYTVTKLPSYQAEITTNPFVTFADIPTFSRYQFMLDDAHYFTSGFIKGPVCRGQIALGAIRDHFWVAFFKPRQQKYQRGIRKQMHNFLLQQHDNLNLPGALGDELSLFAYQKYDEQAEHYLKHKDHFANQLIMQYGGFQIEDIWDGDGSNKNAALTVFRHFDSATVVKGFVGETPLTGWLVDYPLFERIHYLLVAGFDVYSAINQQLASRSYMDYLRIDGENNLLRFMPAEARKAMHASWYKGLSGKVANYINTPYYSDGYETGVKYQTDDYKAEFFSRLKQRISQGSTAHLGCELEACISTDNTALNKAVKQLQQLKGSEIGVLPEVSFIRIRGAENKPDLVYTLIRNKARSNIAFLTGEILLGTREKELDTLTVVPGFLGSYPNVFFNVPQAQLTEFINTLKHAQTPKTQDAFYKKFSIRRTNPDIWQHVDWFNAQHKKQRGIEAGLFDLNRYHNL